MCFRIQMFRKLWSKLQDVILRLILSKNAVSTYARLSAVTSLHTLMYLHGNKPIPVAARSKEWVYWKCGFESRWGHGYLSLVSILSVCVVCCQVQVSVVGVSLKKRRPTECGVSECYLETSTRRRPRLSNRKKKCLKLIVTVRLLLYCKTRKKVVWQALIRKTYSVICCPSDNFIISPYAVCGLHNLLEYYFYRLPFSPLDVPPSGGVKWSKIWWLRRADQWIETTNQAVKILGNKVCCYMSVDMQQTGW
jgi:hypothetical protein